MLALELVIVAVLPDFEAFDMVDEFDVLVVVEVAPVFVFVDVVVVVVVVVVLAFVFDMPLVILVLDLLAFDVVLLVVLSPQAMPRAPSARTVESTITFFIEIDSPVFFKG